MNEERKCQHQPRPIPAFRQALFRWFRQHGRQYPWRETRDPYKILIAELMLRRTQSDQVEPVYLAFIGQYPTLEILESADDEHIEELVYSLGLHWRTSAFKSIARILGEKHNYRVPDTRQELIALPGVGDYVAGAVLSMAFGKKEWIVDTNVARVFKRFYGLDTIKEARRDKKVITLARQYASSRDPRRANLAILDFAALMCAARNPRCTDCPLRRDCAYHRLRLKSQAEREKSGSNRTG